MAEGLDLGWTSFPETLPAGYDVPKRYEFGALRQPIQNAIEKHGIWGWLETELTINDILDEIVDLIELKEV